MNQIPHIIDTMEEVQTSCDVLIKKAELFTQSKDPKVRALGYEINVNVSKIIAQQKVMLKDIQEIRSEIGAMAE